MADGGVGTGGEAARTLAEALSGATVGVEAIRRSHGAELALVRTLLGVVPNCDPYLEIWPPAFQSYNVMVPNLLNLPLLLLGRSAPKDLVGLSMYTSSRASGCAYCSAHTCSFALRRGADTAAVQAASPGPQPDSESGAQFGPRERAVVDAAAALGRVPDTLDVDGRRALESSFSPDDTEWLVLSVAMMGFLNKFMDSMGIPLEQPLVGEVAGIIEPTGWSAGHHSVVPSFFEPELGARPPEQDSASTALALLPHLPSALVKEKRATAGVPSTWPTVGDRLADWAGYRFPVLGELRHKRAIRAIATMIRNNTDAKSSSVGIGTKHLAGIVYGTVVGDRELVAASKVMADRAGAGTADAQEAVEETAPTLADSAEEEPTATSAQLASAIGSDGARAAALMLAAAASPSPARMTRAAVAHASDALEPAAIVELLTWLSVLQMLHRLDVFYDLA